MMVARLCKFTKNHSAVYLKWVNLWHVNHLKKVAKKLRTTYSKKKKNNRKEKSKQKSDGTDKKQIAIQQILKHVKEQNHLNSSDNEKVEGLNYLISSLVSQRVKNPPAMWETQGLGRSFGEGNSYPLQYSDLDNSMDREAWQASPWGHKESDTTEQPSWKATEIMTVCYGHKDSHTNK